MSLNFNEFFNYVYDDTSYNYLSRRYLRDAENPLECYDAEEFQRRYRFRKETVVDVLLPLLFPAETNNISARGLPVPSTIQLLISLRFYATGNFQIVCGDLRKLSQSTVSKIIAKLSKRLALKIREFIQFPDDAECQLVKTKFYEMARFPGVIGCIDCTHIPIKNPNRLNGEVFRNRKGKFSINVQIVCGPQMEIFDIVVRWPGSVHDSRIFNNSRCCMRFEDGDLSGILVGDSGYAQTSYMYTPVLNPTTDAQIRYNRSHIRTRNIIERLNGVLKRRFACLSRTLQNNLPNTCIIIVACAVLHNICIKMNEELPEVSTVNIDAVPVPHVADSERGSLIRSAFIARHFR